MSSLGSSGDLYTKVATNVNQGLDMIDNQKPGLIFLGSWLGLLILLFFIILPGLIFLLIWKILRWAGLSNGWVFFIYILIIAIVALVATLQAKNLTNAYRSLLNRGTYVPQN